MLSGFGYEFDGIHLLSLILTAFVAFGAGYFFGEGGE